MPTNDYSIASKLLHQFALDAPFVAQTSFDIERAIYKTKVSRSLPHVFVTGLARAGTTILMRSLYQTGKFRSLTYHDMPFLFMPNLWSKISKAFRIDGEVKERAHGDGIEVSFNSPEAFEEVFWRIYCGNDYIQNNHLSSHEVNKQILDLFVEYVSLIILNSPKDKGRYLSKNNNNIVRLPDIRRAFRNAVILVPFRDPVQHANSLLRQHLLFTKRHKDDGFSYKYMRWLGHHEFGLTHKPFIFNEHSKVLSYDIMDINYWLTLWVEVYSYVQKHLPEKAFFVSYERLCQDPKCVMEKILKISNVSYNAEGFADFLKAPRSVRV